MSPFTQLATATHQLKVAPRRVLASLAGEDFSLYQPAGFVLRWYALTIDLTFIVPVIMAMRAAMSHHLAQLTAYGHGGRAMLLTLFIVIMPLVLYFVVPTWRTGQTPGKRMVGIRVVADTKTTRLSLGAVLVRETVAKALCFGLFGLGLLLMSRSRRKRALHDYLSGSLVITFNQAATMQKR